MEENCPRGRAARMLDEIMNGGGWRFTKRREGTGRTGG